MGRIAQTAFWVRRAQWMLETSRRRFGETFRLDIAYEGTWVFVTRPDDVKRVFTADPEVLHAGEANSILRPVLGDYSVLLLDRRAHMAQRKLLLPPFHGERMKRYGDVMAEVAVAEIERWPRGEPHRLRPGMQAITLEIILRTVFGITDPDRRERLRVALRTLLDGITDSKQLVWLLALGPDRIHRFPPFARVRGAVDDLIYEEITARRGEPGLEDREDVLSMLLCARHEDGSEMSDVELRDELVTLLVAGHETTATALAWAVERLIRHPDKLARLRDELAAGEDTYLKAVVLETLRLRPVISLVNRTLKQPFEIEGYTLPAGIKVAPCIYLVHRRPDLYPNPEAFEPERFVGKKPDTYGWIPFGGGVRRCLGGAFAQFEMEVVLRELVSSTAIQPTRAADEPVLRRSITETPRYDAEVVLA